jgi:hypothetical protein
MSHEYYIPLRATGRSIGPGKYDPKYSFVKNGVTKFSQVERTKQTPITPRNNVFNTTITKPQSTIQTSVLRLSTPKRVNPRPPSPTRTKMNHTQARFPLLAPEVRKPIVNRSVLITKNGSLTF